MTNPDAPTLLDAARRMLAATKSTHEYFEAHRHIGNIGQCADYVAQIIAEAEAAIAAAEGGGWRPIETAPKDGTPVDLWMVFHDQRPPCRFTDCRWETMTDWRGKEYDGWFFGRGVCRTLARPTHWQPRPPPPQEPEPGDV